MTTRRLAIVFILAVLVAVPDILHAQGQTGTVLIRGGTVITVTKGTLPGTDVLIRNGKISRIDKNINPPEGTRIIDASGKFVMPGIVDAHAHIALSTINEATNAVTAEVQMSDAINPMDIFIYRALAGGVTVSHLLHGSANPIGGENEIIKLRYGNTDPDKLKMEGAPRTIKFALGENPTRVHGSSREFMPRTRMGVEQVIRDAFAAAAAYERDWAVYNEAKKKKGFRGAPPAYSRRLETLAAVLKGEVTIHCHSYRADEILMVMDICRDFGIKRIVFQHANEGYKIAPELKEFGAMASVFSDTWSHKFEAYNSTAYNAVILHRNGILTSINSDSHETIRHLYHEAAKTQKYGGLTDDEALAMITINPARQLGISDRVGSIEVGKDGDVVIFDNHPLSIYSRPLLTLVDGMVYFDAGKDPDDMRISVNPQQEIDLSAFGAEAMHAESCLLGTE